MGQWLFSYEAHPLAYDIYDELREVLDPDYEPPIIQKPIWYNDIETIIEDVHLLEFGILPDPGGWRDQNEFWARDVRQFMKIRSRVLWERAEKLKHDTPDGRDPVDALFDADSEHNAPMGDWDDFLGG